MYTATIYDASKPEYRVITRMSNPISFLLELKVIWYCFRNFPLRHTLYHGIDTDVVIVTVHGVRMAKIVFNETPAEPQLMHRWVPAI